MKKAKLLLGLGVLALGFGLRAAEAASPLCDPTPQRACHQGVNVLKLSKGSDRLSWVWKKGEASPVETFGNPISPTSYGFCVWEGAGEAANLVLSIDVPSGGNWSVTGSGFRYRDRTAGGGSDGVSSVRLKKGAGGTDHPRGRVRLVARGPNVELPSVANANLENLQAQLVNSDGSCWGGKVSLKLEDYPFFPNEVLEEDPEFLNELASQFATTRRLAGKSLDSVVFTSANGPSAVMQLAFEAATAENLPTGKMLWAMELTGYFGGVWFRREMCEQGLQTFVCTQAATVPGEAEFNGIIDAALPGLNVALSASDPNVQQYNVSSLTPDSFDGLAYLFGYNTGYLQSVLDAPSPGSTPPPNFLTNCEDGLLRCQYLEPTLPAVDDLRPLVSILEASALGPQLLANQQGGEPLGMFIWSGPPFGFSVDHFSDEEYQRLLPVSSAFLELIQAPALAGGANVEGGDPFRGRQSALGDSLLATYLAGYNAGLFDPRDGFTDLNLPAQVLPSLQALTPTRRR